jgi:hypothetical protein
MHQNKHFAMYFAIKVLKYYFQVFKAFKKQINTAIRFSMALISKRKLCIIFKHNFRSFKIL